MARKTTTKNAATNAKKTGRKTETIVGKRRTGGPAPEATGSGLIGGKLGLIAASVAAPGGATMDSLIKTTRWQPHTIRAALSRLRKRGMVIALTRVDEGKAYIGQVAG
jgi:hypothetical protein